MKWQNSNSDLRSSGYGLPVRYSDLSDMFIKWENDCAVCLDMLFQLYVFLGFEIRIKENILYPDMQVSLQAKRQSRSKNPKNTRTGITNPSGSVQALYN